MKRCPECRRDYYDDTLLYCLDDGNALLEGPAKSEPPASAGGQFGDEPQTAILHSTDAPGEAPTRAQIHTTDKTAILPAVISDPPKSKGFDKRLILAPVILAGIILGGFFGYRYVTPAKQIESIAVMPFVNDSGNADVEYLSDGMTETLIGSLTRLPNLNVKARSTVFRYKGRKTDAKTIGEELDVQAILNGRVPERGDQLTLSLELVDVQTENAIWGRQYTRKQTDLIALQSEVARDVSTQLKSRLSGIDEAKVTKNYTANPEAYQLFLKGRYFGRQFTLEGFHKSVEYYNQAIALDPNYALTYAGLSDAYFYASTIHLPPLKAMPKAEEYARKALELDSLLAAAHHSIANVMQTYERDFEGAKREYERSIELDPNEPLTFFDYSWVFSTIGEYDQAITAIERARHLDPLAGEIAAMSGATYLMAGQNDKAVEQLQAALKLDDKNWWAHYWLGVTYNQKGMYDSAVESLQTAAGIDNAPLIRGALAHVLARSGRTTEAVAVIGELTEQSKTRYVPSSTLALAYVGLDDKDKAFEWLEKADGSRDEWLLLIRCHPMFKPLHNDARFKDLLKRLNLPE